MLRKKKVNDRKRKNSEQSVINKEKEEKEVRVDNDSHDTCFCIG